jgi:23S rRNA (cytosine1962-C5)-methyltransferase
VLAVSFTTCGMKRRDAMVMRLLEELTGATVLLELPARGVSIDNEGFTAVAEVRKGSLEPGLGGAAPGHVRVRECGLLYDVEPLAAQKTGMFLDQRDNRALVARLARDGRVLDCFSYVGGFALACARAGARQVVAVDSSERACERARAHAQLNGLADRVQVEHEDVFRWLRGGAEGPSADLCILDPPKFARRTADLEQALGHYEQLNALALARVAEGGFLITASCSGAVDETAFERMLVQAAKRAGRRLQLLDRRGAGPDHPTPAGFPEGRYLKLFICRVS